MNKPDFTQSHVFTACVNSVGDPDTRARCNAIAPQMNLQEISYDQLASAGQLYQCVPHPRGGDHTVALGQVTRGEFKGLYTHHMARNGKPARAFYDQIRVSAPDNICPYCGIGVVETIDHFLPKGRYSSLSVLPLNLVPACRDCNTEKLDGIATAGNASSHPYFENQCVFHDEWLFAVIVPAQIMHADFYVHSPISWPVAISQRVSNHFSAFGLARRFSIQAAGRLTYSANLIKDMIDGGVDEGILRILQISAQSELKAHGVNSWQTALAKAVANDFWFRTEGYRQLLSPA